MAADNFARAFPLTLQHEGGWVDHPADPGGATKLGVTLGTLSSWLGRPASKAEVKALTRESVAPIYRKNYWDAIRGDDLPAGLDYAVFDFAVNSGPMRAAMALQRAVGVADDGVIGSITLANVANRPVDSTIERIMADRITFLRRLSTWPTFGKCWTARCDGVLREALDMAAAAPLPVPPVTVTPIPAPAGPLVAPVPRRPGAVPAPAPAQPRAPEPVSLGPTVQTGGLGSWLKSLFSKKAA